MKETSFIPQWKSKIIGIMNEQNALTAQESSSLRRSIQGRAEIEVEAEQDAAQLSVPCCLSPVTIFSSCSPLFLPSFSSFLPIDKRKKKGNFSPGFKSVAALAGWDKEALFIADAIRIGKYIDDLMDSFPPTAKNLQNA